MEFGQAAYDLQAQQEAKAAKEAAKEAAKAAKEAKAKAKAAAKAEAKAAAKAAKAAKAEAKRLEDDCKEEFGKYSKYKAKIKTGMSCLQAQKEISQEVNDDKRKNQERLAKESQERTYDRRMHQGMGYYPS